MSDPTLYCRDERRRDAVRAAPDLNGLDYLDVEPVKRGDPSQGVALVLYFLDKAPQGLKEGNIRLEGGRRIRAEDIGVTGVSTYGQEDVERDDTVRVYLDRWGDFWRFTSQSARRLFEEFFPEGSVTVEAFGNVLSASSLLYGLVREELTQRELNHCDPDYEVLIGVSAHKP